MESKSEISRKRLQAKAKIAEGLSLPEKAARNLASKVQIAIGRARREVELMDAGRVKLIAEAKTANAVESAYYGAGPDEIDTPEETQPEDITAV